MVTPLHVEIAMHYHCRTCPHPMLHNRMHQLYAEELSNAGLLIAIGESGSDITIGYEASAGLRVWIEAICSVPFPVQQWVIPSPSISE